MAPLVEIERVVDAFVLHFLLVRFFHQHRIESAKTPTSLCRRFGSIHAGLKPNPDLVPPPGHRGLYLPMSCHGFRGDEQERRLSYERRSGLFLYQVAQPFDSILSMLSTGSVCEIIDRASATASGASPARIARLSSP